jgi:hypothetical protein
MTTASRAHRPVIAATALMTLLMLVCTACGAAPHPTATVRSCNGSSTLCSRPVNEVIFPGTHNSFAASNEPGWYFANQTYPIARQLHDGIRALLIDIHYGVYDAATGRVRTDLANPITSSQSARQAKAIVDHSLAFPRVGRRVTRWLKMPGRQWMQG